MSGIDRLFSRPSYPPTGPERRHTAVVAVDADDVPVPGARVSMRGAINSTLPPLITNADGYAAWEVWVPDDVTVTIEHDSALTYVGSYRIGGGDTIRVTLTPKRQSPPIIPILVQGKSWTVIPRYTSALSILRRTETERDHFLDWAEATGFNGIRIFAGALTWAGQSPEMARERLPALLAACAERGLGIEVTAVTDSGTGYDWRAHLTAVRAMCEPWWHTLVEGANEIGHPSQARDLTAAAVAEVLSGCSRPWSVGAPMGLDEPIKVSEQVFRWVEPWGTYVTVHGHRGDEPRRDRWEESRRVREGANVADLTGTPVLDNERIGAASVVIPGKRDSDPARFAVHGALGQAWGMGGILHSSPGLEAVIPDPIVQACADAYVDTAKAVSLALDGHVGSYRNAGGAGSPVASIDPTEITRHYCFVRGAVAASVRIGERRETTRYADGWRAVGETYRRRSDVDGRSVIVTRLEHA